MCSVPGVAIRAWLQRIPLRASLPAPLPQVSSGSAKLANLQLAIQSHTDRMPALATLLPGAASEESTSLAQRLALRTHRPVLCSVNLPKGSPMLQAIAEKRLFQEIKDMGLCAPAASSSSDGIAPVAASTHTATATDGAPPAQS